jgi:hypothetical protein
MVTTVTRRVEASGSCDGGEGAWDRGDGSGGRGLRGDWLLGEEGSASLMMISSDSVAASEELLSPEDWAPRDAAMIAPAPIPYVEAASRVTNFAFDVTTRLVAGM